MFHKLWASFCTKTTVEGFKEIFEARKMFSFCFWCLLVLFAWTCTAYQMHGEILNYFEKETSTRISYVNKNGILYPPLRLCYSHWMHWVDFAKVQQLNISKDVMLYGLRYVKGIYTTSRFNLTSAEEGFLEKMDQLGYKTVSEFLNAIARDEPIIGNISTCFEDRELFFETALLYCYILPSNRILEYFTNRMNTGGKKTILSFGIPYENYKVNSNNLSQFVSYDEYFQYSKLWISTKTTYKLDMDKYKEELTNFAQPILMYPNMYDNKQVAIFSDVSKYMVTFTGSVFTWKSQKQRSCRAEERSVASNTTCKFKCLAVKYKYSNCTCQHFTDAVLLNEDEASELCINALSFLSPNSARVLKNLTVTGKSQKCIFGPESSAFYNQCQSECGSPCQIWKYEFNVVQVVRPYNVNRSVSVHKADIEIEYPSYQKIIMLVEEESQTWERFVGNVGGLLGVWTGASILSLMQAVYLCFCICDYE